MLVHELKVQDLSVREVLIHELKVQDLSVQAVSVQEVYVQEPTVQEVSVYELKIQDVSVSEENDKQQSFGGPGDCPGSVVIHFCMVEGLYKLSQASFARKL